MGFFPNVSRAVFNPYEFRLVLFRDYSTDIRCYQFYDLPVLLNRAYVNRFKPDGYLNLIERRIGLGSGGGGEFADRNSACRSRMELQIRHRNVILLRILLGIGFIGQLQLYGLRSMLKQLDG